MAKKKAAPAAKKATKKPVAKKATKPAAANPAVDKKPVRERKPPRVEVDGSPELVATVSDLAETIRNEMKAEGLDVAGLAARMKLTEARIAQFVGGRALSLRTIVEIFTALNRRIRIVVQ